ncbi:recombination protein RecR [Candidatus Kaiserbacteria bacterium]|nr:recombination protein RecR [Candidatus Kaiserbacteria bacterium]
MDTIQKLMRMFIKFPGIGPRQAERFVYFLLSSPQSYRQELMRLIGTLKDDTKVCVSCFRFHSNRADICSVCGNANRNKELLMLVQKDVDLDNIERTKDYDGYYFVIGGTVPILDKNPSTLIREKELIETVEKRAKDGLKEVIFAFSVNPDGENTAEYVRKVLEPLLKKSDIKISTLGRGLSTGLELEYSDPETIKNALKNRV